VTKKAFITGITGQDGSYLSELLLSQGYEVHGAVRRTSTLERSRLAHLYADPDIYNQRLFLHYADLDDPTTLRRVLNQVQPHELYHLAGQSHVGLSFEIPETTCEFTAMGTLRLLEILRDLPDPPRFFHATSSEIFGRPAESPQTEATPMAPINPYGCAKAFATQMVRVYRDSHGLFAVNGILYNHESSRRGENFVTRKICHAAAAIKLNQQRELVLGDTSALRDWGHARDYVRGMWLALNHQTPADYVFATGQLHTVQQVIETAFAAVTLDWRDFVRFDSHFLRPAEPLHLVGDASKARAALGWMPQTSFQELIQEMTQSELDHLSHTDSRGSL
jgi:GDPmannose 4,6-dehydratase